MKERCREYVYERLLPLARDRGWDAAHGGFHERLDASGHPLKLGYKRLLVQCRQLYTLSAAVSHGVDEGFAALAHETFAFLTERYRHPHRGWVFTVTPEGEPLDQKRDTYGHAFVIFALAHYHRAFGESAAKELASETLTFLDKEVRGPGSGFLEGLDSNGRRLPGPRRQNPHMHLLEGLLAWETPPDDRFEPVTEELLGLFEERFFDGASGTLGEYFADDWSTHPEQGYVVEPGHHFEWSWLLSQGDAPRVERANSLLDWAFTHGIDERGGVFDEVDREGRVVTGSQRIWPATECVKSCAVRFARTRNADDRARFLGRLEFLFDRYLKDDGRWVEHLDETGAVINDTLPGTTSYHIAMALFESIRVLEETT